MEDGYFVTDRESFHTLEGNSDIDTKEHRSPDDNHSQYKSDSEEDE